MTPSEHRLRGVLSPVLTPFGADYTPDTGRFIRHCRWLLDQEVGLAIFGTNSEANSLSTAEKRQLFDALMEAGLPPQRMMPGTGCCSITDSIELTRRAVQAGAGGVLMLPPFYYKGLSEEGLYRNFATIIDKVADDRLRIYLYHIPPVSSTPIPRGLVARLLKAYPGMVAGMKDSGGDWNYTQAMIDEFGPQGFDVFSGSENFLLANLRAGGPGCITATANVNPTAIVHLYKTWQEAGADQQQKELDATRSAFSQFPMISAMKSAVAWKSGRNDWIQVRPPLVGLNPEQQQALKGSLDAVGFTMPNAGALV
jgi:4-hydroxy-tetrahydrodipicolinate synthase